MNPLAGRNLKHKVRDENQSQKEKYIFKRPVYRLIRIGHFNKRDTERGCVETGDCVGGPFGTHTPRDEGYRPLRGEAVSRDLPGNGQESSIESRTWPVTLRREMSGVAVGEHSNPLRTRKAHVGGYIESCIWRGQALRPGA